MPDDPQHDSQRGAGVLKHAPLLNVQLQVGRDRAGAPGHRLDRVRPPADGGQRLAQGAPGVVAPVERLPIERAGQRHAADAGDPERRWLLGQEVDHFERVAQPDAGGVERADDRDAGQHTEHPVEATRAGHGIGVRADHERRQVGGAVAMTHQVAGGVHGGRQPGRPHLVGQPGPAGDERWREGPARPARSARLDKGRQRVEVAEQTRSVDRQVVHNGSFARWKMPSVMLMIPDFRVGPRHS